MKDDEEFLIHLAETLDIITRLNYDYIEEYLPLIDQLANSLMDRDFQNAAKLAIGVWSTVA
jgi:hypothetical protein